MDSRTLKLGDSPAVRVGRWWFKLRSLSPLPLFLLLILLPAEFHPRGIGLLLPLAGILAAEGVRLWAVGFAGSATRTRGETVTDFVHAGPYRYVRNPLYVANIAMYTLCGVVFGAAGLSVLIFAYSAVQYTFIVAFEEEVLTRTFGQAYLSYCASVPRWLVSPLPRYPGSRHRFDLARAFRSERSTLLSMMIMSALFFIKRRLL